LLTSTALVVCLYVLGRGAWIKYYGTEAAALDWKMRVNVVKGVAKALSYMHHGCSPPIMHRGISIENVAWM